MRLWAQGWVHRDSTQLLVSRTTFPACFTPEERGKNYMSVEDINRCAEYKRNIDYMYLCPTGDFFIQIFNCLADTFKTQKVMLR